MRPGSDSAGSSARPAGLGRVVSALRTGRESLRIRFGPAAAAASPQASPAADAKPAPAPAPPPRNGYSAVRADRVESFIAITDEGKVVACNGHVDLGTGLRTAFAQIVAEELDVSVDDVVMVMGHTDRTPDQGPTTASASIQVSAVPMRQAAAQARAFLVRCAAARWGVAAQTLSVAGGVVRHPDGPTLSYGELLEGAPIELALDTTVAVKPTRDYRIVGTSVPRLDIPAKVTGGLTYVHDVRLPGMLHARVVRPPGAGRDAGQQVGHSLVSVDAQSIRGLPGIEQVVVVRDFVAVVAQREEVAIQAARMLRVQWRAPPALPDLSDIRAALEARPVSPRVLKQAGDVDAILSREHGALSATYVWPYQMHASIGPSCGVAHYADGTLTVWSGTQNAHLLHADIAQLTGVADADIRIIRLEASGCYGRNCADDAAAEAALIAVHIGGRPVRVQLSREEEHGWEPKGTAQLIKLRGAVLAGDNLAYDFEVRYPSNNAPLLALLQTGRGDSQPVVERKGDRTAVPQYRLAHARIVACDMAPIVRAAWLRGVSAMPNVFAHESFIDELAAREEADPIAFRLRFMTEPRAIALTRELMRLAAWTTQGRHPVPASDGIVRGRGFAQHQYVHGTFPGTGAAWCAWVCDVEVNLATGVVRVTRVHVGYDCGLMINPAGVRHQIHGNVIQSISRVLKEQVGFDAQGVSSLEWGAYPVLRFDEVPDITVHVMPHEGRPPLGVGESASVPSAAAIANAVHDATGIRFREVPLTPQRVRAALATARQAVQNQGEPV